jgi:hypothetical protein
MVKFERKESFTHLYAKKLLAEWLQHGIELHIGNWKRRVSSGNHFTHLEYPITECYPNYIDECGCNNYDKKTMEKLCICEYRKHEIIESPCIKCDYLRGPLLAVSDIATAHKGYIPHLFEIVNKNEDIDEKLELYAKIGYSGGESYFISAQHILGQIQRPNALYALAATITRDIIRD